MAVKKRNLVENIIALIILGLIVGAGAYLMIILFFSPSVP